MLYYKKQATFIIIFICNNNFFVSKKYNFLICLYEKDKIFKLYQNLWYIIFGINIKSNIIFLCDVRF